MSELKTVFYEDFDKGDKWGSAMIAFFTVANEINHREQNTPSSWQYRPSPVMGDQREHDDGMFEACENANLNDLIHFGNILERYTQNLDRLGVSY